jgi:hypothetical protein
LVAKLNELAATISDELDRLDCLAEIEQYGGILQALSTAQAGGVASYSLNGRSVTRRNPNDVRADAAACRVRIERLLYSGCVRLADMSEAG